VSPKRLDRVAPPPIKSEWEVRFGTTEAGKGWDDLCRQAATNMRAAFEVMRSNPRPPHDGMHYRLRGSLGVHQRDGHDLEQWQIKVTGAGRIWYLIDDLKHTVWVVRASPAHPKETD
jgi:mRNA-degrading endonuclease RelE of RelBE toxin-antitoxin system